mgnify:FL=1
MEKEAICQEKAGLEAQLLSSESQIKTLEEALEKLASQVNQTLIVDIWKMPIYIY